MIKKIRLINFKKFSDFSVSCKDTNILVGPNNSGKSTILDALRLCNDVLTYARRKNPTVKTIPGDDICASYEAPQTILSVSVLNVCRDYADDPAEIHLTHTNGKILKIFVHPERTVRAHLVSSSIAPKTATAFQTAFPCTIVVVPTLSPVEAEEQLVTNETVQRNETTRLASRSFRNIWLRKAPDEFGQFASLVTSAWRDIVVYPPETTDGQPRRIYMYYEEGRITREIHWSGFGLQVWMQMMTHILRGDDNSVLVLDEPDIYLHADLQRKLLKIVKEKFGQVFLATHSTEIINEASPGDVVTISSTNRHARRITSETGYREIYAYLGSSENAELSRVIRAKRVVFFEGKDRRLLRKFSSKIDAGDLLDDPDTVFLQAGGFSQWRRVKEVNWTLENLFGLEVKIAAIFDRDYRCQEEVSDFLNQINGDRIRCYVLDRKEIENYSLNFNCLVRVVRKAVEKRDIELSDGVIENIIESLSASMHAEVRSQILTNHLTYVKSKEKKLDDSTIAAEALERFDSLWTNLDTRLQIIPGKDFISALSSKLGLEFGVSISPTQLINGMHRDEIDTRLAAMLTEIAGFFED